VTWDVIVAGAGTAGLVAAVRAAQAGRRVLVLAKGHGATHLAPLTIDVLGYAPERVESPAAELGAFLAAHPEHPYARTGEAAIAEALDWFAGEMAADYPYTGGLERNILLPSALGSARPSALVPVTMAEGDLRRDDPICLVGLRPLKDFHAALAADNLTRIGIRARAVELDLPTDRVDINSIDVSPVAIARAFDRPEVRAVVASQLALRLQAGERVGFPAVLGLRHAHAVWQELQERLGRPVFEIPTLPPSVPGLRVDRILTDALRAAGGRIIVSSEVVGAQPDATGVTVRASAAARDIEHRAQWLVLATGGFAEGALMLDADWQARETLLDLPLAHVPGPGEPRFAPGYDDEQPMARVGVAVDAGLRPVGPGGARVHERVLVAGAAIGGAVPWKEHSGEGISVTTGYHAANEIADGSAVGRELAGGSALGRELVAERRSARPAGESQDSEGSGEAG
jgi:glycerol-3-phosphate dehydrogenase subunit B